MPHKYSLFLSGRLAVQHESSVWGGMNHEMIRRVRGSCEDLASEYARRFGYVRDAEVAAFADLSPCMVEAAQSRHPRPGYSRWSGRWDRRLLCHREYSQGISALSVSRNAESTATE
jgi:hypothetical protein